MKKVILAINLVLFSSVLGMENRNAEWFEAARSGNLAAIDRMIKNDMDLNVRDGQGNTALMIAAKETRLEVVKRLVKKVDSKVSALDVILDFVNAWKTGRPWSDRNLVRWKNNIGLDLFAQNNDGNTALMLAVESAHSYDQDQAEAQFEIVSQLHSAFWALYSPFVCKGGDIIQKVKKMLRFRAKLDRVKNNRGETAFQIALENAVRFPNTLLPLHIAEELLVNSFYGNLSEKNSRGETLLMLQIDRDYYTRIGYGWYVLGARSGWRGFDINEKDRNGTTALMRVAIGDGKVEALKVMLGILPSCSPFQVDVNAENCWDWNALHFAVAKGSPEKVRMLIEHGADVNARTRGGMTPLKIARGRRNADMMTVRDIVAQLIEVGAR